MSQQPVEIARDPWGAILHHPAQHTLELQWFASTQQMTDDDFKSSLELYATAAEQLRPIACLLIDSREFLHTFGDPSVLQWRDERIIPRYNAAGVRKFAFVMPAGTPGTVESGAAPSIDGPASFPTAWFTSRERAEAWLAQDG
jgi:hypothetical protein